MARFIQIHWLASYPAALLNRDDAGLAKRIPFGGATRGRISSQCLKRRWRLAGADSIANAEANPWALQNVGVQTSVRTKEVVEQRIRPRLEEQSDADSEVLDGICGRLIEAIYGDKAGDPKKRQALLLGEPRVDVGSEQRVHRLGNGRLLDVDAGSDQALHRSAASRSSPMAAPASASASVKRK